MLLNYNIVALKPISDLAFVALLVSPTFQNFRIFQRDFNTGIICFLGILRGFMSSAYTFLSVNLSFIHSFPIYLEQFTTEATCSSLQMEIVSSAQWETGSQFMIYRSM